jgi:hypothetical protein
MRTIVIVGHWFCGSTLLNGLVNGVPGVAGVGELQWLKDDRGTTCSACGGRDCDLVRGVCRPGLRDSNLYRRAAEALGCEVLVTSDKVPRTIERFIVPGAADGVLMFKRPEAFAASFARHKSEDTPRSCFLQFYPQALVWCAAQLRRFVVLEYEKVAARPRRTMEDLCMRLHLPQPEVIEHPPKTWHNIRGNMVSLKSKRYKERPIHLDERWRDELTSDYVQRIQSDSAVMNQWRRLQELAI